MAHGANQGLSKVESRHGHAVCSLWAHPPVPFFLLTPNLYPMDIA